MNNKYYIIKFNKPIFVHHIHNKKQFKGRFESIHKYLNLQKLSVSSIEPETAKQNKIDHLNELERTIDNYVKLNIRDEETDLIESFLHLLLDLRIVDSYSLIIEIKD